MKFLFDIDDTLSQTSQPWEDLSRQYLTKKGYKRIEGVEPGRKIEDCFEMTRQQKGLYMRWMWEHFDFRHLQPTEGAVETLAELVKLGHKIDFVTARMDFTWKQTSDWLQEYFGDVLKEKYVINYLHDLPALSSFDVLIDDNPHRALLAKEKGKLAVLVDPYCEYEDANLVMIRRLPDLLKLTRSE